MARISDLHYMQMHNFFNAYGQAFKNISESLRSTVKALQHIINPLKQILKAHKRALHLANHHKKDRTRKKNINRLRREIRLALKRGQI